MKIFVKVKPNSGQEKIEKIDEAHFVVSVKEPPKEGRANAALLRALAGHFGVSGSQIAIVAGHRSKTKIVEIN